MADSQRNVNGMPPPLLSVAPMMDQTDVYFRQLCRLISRNTWLWTEMIVDTTLIHNPQTDRFLWFPPEQHPIVCQLGGSDPAKLAAAAAKVDRYGYDEINLNCGCPSSRVAGAGCFGAALMAEPQLVADCCAAMAAVTDIPITVKCRLGVDDVDSYQQLCNFVRTVSEGSPVRHFIVHCRKAILNLDTVKNRSVPPLRRGWAFALRRDFPHLHFSVNGQVDTTEEALQVLAAEPAPGAKAAGVMIGRAAWKRPWDCFSDADRAVFNADSNAATSRRQVLQQYAEFADSQLGRWHTRPDGSVCPSVRALTAPILQLFFGEKGGSRWKAAVDQVLRRATTVTQLLDETLSAVPDEVLDAPPKVISVQPSDAVMELELPPPVFASTHPAVSPVAAPEEAGVSSQMASGSGTTPQQSPAACDSEAAGDRQQLQPAARADHYLQTGGAGDRQSAEPIVRQAIAVGS